jgi:hypothetical protein
VANQYDPIIVNSGIPTVLGTNTLRSDKTAEAGLTTTGFSAGDVVQVTSNLTLAKASNQLTTPIVGVYDGVAGSVVREGIVVATFVSGLTLLNGDAVYLSSTAGQLTNVKPLYDCIHEIGVIVDATNKKILLQQKPVIWTPPNPTTIWVGTATAHVVTQYSLTGAVLGTVTIAGDVPAAVCYDGTNIWILTYSGYVYKVNASTRAILGSYNTGVSSIYKCTCSPGYVWATSVLLNPDGKKLVRIAVSDGTVTVYTPSSYYLGAPVYHSSGYLWVPYTDDYSVYGLYKIDPTNGSIVATYGNHYAAADLTGGCATDTYVFHASQELGRWVASTGSFTYNNNLSWQGSPCWDGVNLWVPQGYSQIVNKMSTNLGNLAAYNVGGNPFHCGYDGTNIWVTCKNDNIVVRLSPAGVVLGTYSLTAPNVVCSTAHVLPWPTGG